MLYWLFMIHREKVVRIKGQINFQSIKLKSIVYHYMYTNLHSTSRPIHCISFWSTWIEYKLTNVRRVSLRVFVYYQIFITSSSKKHTIPPSFLCLALTTYILETKKLSQVIVLIPNQEWQRVNLAFVCICMGNLGVSSIHPLGTNQVLKMFPVWQMVNSIRTIPKRV